MKAPRTLVGTLLKGNDIEKSCMNIQDTQNWLREWYHTPITYFGLGRKLAGVLGRVTNMKYCGPVKKLWELNVLQPSWSFLRAQLITTPSLHQPHFHVSVHLPRWEGREGSHWEEDFWVRWGANQRSEAYWWDSSGPDLCTGPLSPLCSGIIDEVRSFGESWDILILCHQAELTPSIRRFHRGTEE